MDKGRGIDLGAFLDLLDGHVTEGDNADEFYVDEKGVRSIVAPTVDDRAELHIVRKRFRGRDEKTKAITDELQQSEADILREFAKDCEIKFPCDLEAVKTWALVIINVKPDDIDRRYRELKGEPPGHGRLERRESLERIIKAMQEIDPELSIKDMPGTKSDLLGFCKKLDNHLFEISEYSFGDVIKGWIAFAGGRHKGTSDYYSADRLNEVRSRLG